LNERNMLLEIVLQIKSPLWVQDGGYGCHFED
jgi:hypothetical protein